MSTSFVALACLCAAVAGCTSAVGGHGTAASPAGKGSGTGGPTTSSALPSGTPSDAPTNEPSGSSGSGDQVSTTALSRFRKVDPCTMIPADTFTILDPDAQLELVRQTYDSCGLGVTLKLHGKPASRFITVEFLNHSEAKSVGSDLQVSLQQGSKSGHVVLSGTAAKVGCVRALVLADGLSVGLIAEPGTGVSADSLCDIADAMLTGSINVLQAEGYHSLDVPKNSIGLVDICARLNGAVTSILGSGLTHTPQLHGCDWYGPDRSTVSVSLQSDHWPPGLPGPNPQKVTVNGRPGLIGISSGANGVFSVSQLRLGVSALSPTYYDIASVLVGAKTNIDGLQAKVRSCFSQLTSFS